MAQEFRLDGEVAVVTGGTAGIGLAIARRLATAGAHVVICGRDKERGAAAEQELSGAGEVAFTPADVTVPAQVETLRDATQERFGPATILINNAGPTDLLHSRSVDAPLGVIDLENWDALMGRTVTAVFLPTRYFLPAMTTARTGAIVNISSMSAVQPIPGFDGYAVGKGAVEALTSAVAASYRHLGIRCNTIRVGRIAVDHGGGPRLAAQVPEAEIDWSKPTMPPAGEPDDIALAALYLVSPAARYVNGVVLPVDGGVGIMSPIGWQTARPEMR